MQEKHSLIQLTDEQVITWYQHHIQVLHGYALALAKRAGLSPEEAANVFVEPWHGSQAGKRQEATPAILERQAQQAAEVLALTHGEKHVQIEQQGDTWSITVTIIDPEPFERYGASLEMHT